MMRESEIKEIANMMSEEALAEGPFMVTLKPYGEEMMERLREEYVELGVFIERLESYGPSGHPRTPGSQGAETIARYRRKLAAIEDKIANDGRNRQLEVDAVTKSNKSNENNTIIVGIGLMGRVADSYGKPSRSLPTSFVTVSVDEDARKIWAIFTEIRRILEVWEKEREASMPQAPELDDDEPVDIFNVDRFGDAGRKGLAGMQTGMQTPGFLEFIKENFPEYSEYVQYQTSYNSTRCYKVAYKFEKILTINPDNVVSIEKIG